jgi:hypothetical protein
MSAIRAGYGYLLAATVVIVSLPAMAIADPPRGEPPIFAACTRLLETKNDDNWQEVLDLAASLRDETLKRAERSPLEKPDDLADPKKLIQLPLAAPGLHSTVHTVRYASTLPPGPAGSYLHTAAVVIHGDFVATTPRLLKPSRRPRTLAWDGYIHGCVLLVDGEIDLTGYLFNSIVIAKGPVYVGGYIYNSLVFSLGAEGESLIEVGGYLHHALVVSERVKVPGYVFKSIVYGTLECSDLRGAELRKPNAMLRLPWEIE